MTASFAVAPNFQCKVSWADRLRIAEDGGWRAPREDELASLAPNAPGAAADQMSWLFTVPMHLRTRFWDMLDREAAEGAGDFVNFSEDLAEFLKFKDLPPPKDATCDLLLQDAAGTVMTSDVWALINFGEDPVALAWPERQMRLDPGEGFRTVAGAAPDIVPPAGDDLNVLVAIRFAAA